MRAAFALVLTLGVGAAITVSAIRRHSSDTVASPSAEDDAVLVSQDTPATDAATEAAPDTDEAPPLVARLDEALARDDLDAASAALLRADASHLRHGSMRERAFRVADGLAHRTGASATAGRLAARRIYSAIYDQDATPQRERDRAFEGVRDIHRAVLFGHNAADDVVLRHEISPGDRVWTLWKGPWREAGVSVSPGFILHVNGIRNAAGIRVGQILRVPKEPLSLLIRKSTFELTVLLGGAPVERFAVGIGKDEGTPSGTFEIESRLENPDWYFEGRRIPFGHPDHIIGTRWMGFTGDPTADGIGIHGTTDASSIGKAESLGCIRMRDADVERLFDWVAKGTRVEIRD